jgi:hypothetical protein
MNERIREFAEQAFTAVGTTHDSITHQDQSVLDKNDTITVYTFTQNTMEKFAELIVQECIECTKEWYEARIADSARDYSRGYVHGCDEAIAEMKKRFGVEE